MKITSCYTRTAAMIVAGTMSASIAMAQTTAESTAMANATEDSIVRYTGTVVRTMPNTRPFELRLDRWSTETDRNAVVGAFKAADNPAEFADALKDMPAIGGFRTISGQANPIRYAEEVVATDGTRKLIVLSDRQVDYWQGANASDVVQNSYTVMEIRFKDGKGEGIVSHGPTEVVIDDHTQTLTIEDFSEKPAQLIGVAKLEKGEGFDLDEMMDDIIDTVSAR